MNDMSAIIAASIAASVSLINIVVSIFFQISNNRKLKAIERQKHLDEMTVYRYTKLHQYLEELESYHGITDVDIETNNVSSKRLKFWRLYILSKPLVDIEIRKNVDAAFRDEQRSHSELQSNGKENNPVDLSGNFLSNLNKFQRALSDTIQEQISKLLRS